MSNRRKFYDNTEFITPAGKTTAIEGVSVDNSLRQDIYFEPSTQTPEHILKYRNTLKERPGVKQYHPGIYDDPKYYEEIVHGQKTQNSLHVNDCIKGNNINGNQLFMNQLKEKLYSSSIKEPLGHSLQRNYQFPDQVKDPNFKFGVSTTGLLNAKELIYQGCMLNETPEIQKQYEKTHGITQPGQQKDRNYQLHFDKNQHMYGFNEEKELNGVKNSLNTDTLTNSYPSTKIVHKRLEDFRQATEDMLGKSKYKGTLNPNLNEDHIYGYKNILEQWNAGKCIHGDTQLIKQNALQPDIDLGKNSHFKEKVKNKMPLQKDPNKIYGVPSIRNDLPTKNFVSVTDTNNYGNDKDAFELLYPHPCSTQGLDDEHFDKLVSKEQINEMIKQANIFIPPEEVNLMYQIALKNYPNTEQKISSNSFIATMKNLKREYMKYRTLV